MDAYWSDDAMLDTDPAAQVCDLKDWPCDELVCDSTWSEAGRTARAAVLNWRIVAVGRRSVDHLTRDLLFGSLFRDSRPRRFHQSVQDPPDWVEAAVAHLPEKDQGQAIRLVVLHHLHLRTVAALLADQLAFYGGSNEEYELTLKQLPRCWPYGALVGWAGLGQRDGRDVCRRAWLCPWCFARRVVSVYERLRNYLRQGAAGDRYLLLTQFFVIEDQFIHDPDVRGFLQRGGPRNLPASWRDADPLSQEKLLAEIDCLRGRVKNAVMARLAGCGIRGGLWAHQVGPWLRDEVWEARAFRHEMALLAEVSFASATERRRLEKATGVGGGKPPWLGDQLASSVLSLLLPAQDPRALRFFLAGSPAGYPLDNLALEANSPEYEMQLLKDGIPGAFKLQPVFMFDAAQHWAYAEAVKQLPLYWPFGTWREALGKLRRQPPKRLLPQAAPKGKRRQLAALRRINRAKEQRGSGRLNCWGPSRKYGVPRSAASAWDGPSWNGSCRVPASRPLSATYVGSAGCSGVGRVTSSSTCEAEEVIT